MSSKVKATKAKLEDLGNKIDNINVWWKRLGALVGIIGAVWAGCAAISNTITSTLDERIVHQIQDTKEQIDEMSSKITTMEEILNRTKMDTTRLQLMMLINHQPEQHSTILEVADLYFVYYHGDWIMTDLFIKWAEEQGVRVPMDILARIQSE